MKKNQIDLENILLSYIDPKRLDIDLTAQSFYDGLEAIYNNLGLDATKIYEFDPAASSVSEVIVSYPGFYAITVYRIAQALVKLKIHVPWKIFFPNGLPIAFTGIMYTRDIQEIHGIRIC